MEHLPAFESLPTLNIRYGERRPVVWLRLKIICHKMRSCSSILCLLSQVKDPKGSNVHWSLSFMSEFYDVPPAMQDSFRTVQE